MELESKPKRRKKPAKNSSGEKAAAKSIKISKSIVQEDSATTAAESSSTTTTTTTTTTTKVFLNGNAYYKLSGLYLTSLDYSKAIAEWNAIPYLQTMYGAPLVGYYISSATPDWWHPDLPRPEGFFYKDEPISQKYSGYTFYPVYEKKDYALSNGLWEEDALSALNSDLTWLSGELVRLKVEYEDASLPAGGCLSAKDIANGSSLTLLSSSQSEITVSLADFEISAIAKGGSAYVSDFIDVAQPESGTAKVISMNVVPKKTLDVAARNYKRLLGQAYSISGEKNAGGGFLDLVCGFPAANVRVRSTKTGYPLKTPYLYSTIAPGMERYYQDLGYGDLVSSDRDGNYLARFLTFGDAASALSTEISGVPLPNLFTVKYETTICPDRDGFYKFLYYADNTGIIVVDDKIVGVDCWLSSLQGKLVAVNNLLSGLLSANEAISESGRILDSEQIRSLLSTNNGYGYSNADFYQSYATYYVPGANPAPSIGINGQLIVVPEVEIGLLSSDGSQLSTLGTTTIGNISSSFIYDGMFDPCGSISGYDGNVPLTADNAKYKYYSCLSNFMLPNARSPDENPLSQIYDILQQVGNVGLPVFQKLYCKLNVANGEQENMAQQRTAYYSHGANIFLKGGSRYKLTIFTQDSERYAEYFSSPELYSGSFVDGETGLNLLIHFTPPVVVEHPPELYTAEAYAFVSDAYHDAAYSYYPPISAIVSAGLSAKATSPLANLSSYLSCYWSNWNERLSLDGYSLVPAGNYYFVSPMLKNEYDSCEQVFTTSNKLEESEIDALANNVYLPGKVYTTPPAPDSMEDAKKTIRFASYVNQHLLNGPIRWREDN